MSTVITRDTRLPQSNTLNGTDFELSGITSSNLAIATTSDIQQRLSSLLEMPIEKWNLSTIREGFLDIARVVLADPDCSSTLSGSFGLADRAKDIMRSDHPFGRALNAIATSLKDIEETFESMVTFNRYKGQELENRTQQLYASMILHVLSMTAPQNGDVSYLTNLFKQNRPGLDFTAYSHIAGDLQREINFEPGEKRDRILQSLRTLVSSALKKQLAFDIEQLVSKHELFASDKTDLLATLDTKPEELKKHMARLINRTSARTVWASEVGLHSEARDREYRDLNEFREYALNRLFTVYSGTDRSVFKHYCQSVGTYPRLERL